MGVIYWSDEGKTPEQRLRFGYLLKLLSLVFYMIIEIFLIFVFVFVIARENPSILRTIGIIAFLIALPIALIYHICAMVRVLKDRKFVDSGKIIKFVGLVEKSKLMFNFECIISDGCIVYGHIVQNIETKEKIVLKTGSGKVKQGNTYTFYYLKNARIYTAYLTEEVNIKSENQIEQNTQSTVSNKDQTEQQKDKHE